MDHIDMNDDLITGVAEIDAQHKLLFEIYNELVDAKNEGHGTKVMNEILARLFQYTKEHFASEEELLEARRYEKFDEHHKHHMDLVKSIRHYVLRHTRNGERISGEMLTFLRKWITEHIMVEDMKYVECLSGPVASDKNSEDTEQPTPA